MRSAASQRSKNRCRRRRSLAISRGPFTKKPANATRRLVNEQRELSTQLDRLSSLAAQYDQDVKKLGFAKEARSPSSIRLQSKCAPGVCRPSMCQVCNRTTSARCVIRASGPPKSLSMSIGNSVQ